MNDDNGYASKDTTKNWSALLAKEPTPLVVDIKRIRTNESENKPRYTELTNNHPNAIAIFRAFTIALSSQWFNDLTQESSRPYLTVIHQFINWLNSQSTVSYDVVKNFESYRVNINKVKSQSSGAIDILRLLEAVLSASGLTDSEQRFIASILKKTHLALRVKQDNLSLCSWLKKHIWIRDILGDRYLKLESPKHLIASFQVTVAKTLLFLFELKRALTKKLEKQSKSLSDYLGTPETYDALPDHQKLVFVGQLFRGCASFNNGTPLDTLSQHLLDDIVARPKVDMVLDKIDSHGIESIKPTLTVGNHNVSGIFNLPRFFTPSLLKMPSDLEQLLTAWLCASLMVQPDDVWKLKRNNFAIEQNSIGTPRLLQIVYYKGRSGIHHETPLLKTQDVVARALLQYLDFLPKEREVLFENKQKPPYFLNPFYEDKGQSRSNKLTFLFLIWRSNELQHAIADEAKKRKTSTIFLDAMNAMTDPRAISKGKWLNQNKKRLVSDYHAEVKYFLPDNIFGLNLIKTCSVHGNTDRYRDGDLVNYNSHTSLTEKLSYLTDDNKDWVNQAGRITRLVLRDMETYVYKPNLSAVKADVVGKITRTQIVSSTNNQDIRINQLGEASISDHPVKDIDSILVIDSKETALFMLHYIAQADRNANRLMCHNPEFFTRTVLVNVEWMHNTLGQLNATHVNDATLTYNEIREYLPNLFASELQGGITA